MKISWIKGLDEQQKLDITQKYKEAGLVRRRLEKVLRDLIEEKRNGSVSEQLYDSPNWAYQQADRAGYERALRDVISMITDKD